MAKKRRKTKKEKKTVKKKKNTSNWLRNAGMISLGFVSLTASRKFSKAYSAKKCKDEGRRLKDKYMDKAKERRDCLLGDLNIATKEDLDSLERRIKR